MCLNGMDDGWENPDQKVLTAEDQETQEDSSTAENSEGHVDRATIFLDEIFAEIGPS